MPSNRQNYRERCRYNLKDLNIASLQYGSPPQKGHVNDQLRNCMTYIYEKFEQWGLGEQGPLLPSALIEEINSMYSKKTVIKAKRLLGVQSRKSDSIWFWTPPTRTVVEAEERWMLQREKKNRDVIKKINRLTRTAAQILGRILRSNGYIVRNEKAKVAMSDEGYSIGTIHNVKRDMGILSIKDDLEIEDRVEWFWVWTPYELYELLEEILSNGPLLLDDIQSRLKEKGIKPAILIYIIRNYQPTFNFALIKDRGVAVRSVNEERNITYPELDLAPAPSAPAPPAPRNEIEIDFSEDEPPQEVSGDSSQENDEYVPMDEDYWIN